MRTWLAPPPLAFGILADVGLMLSDGWSLTCGGLSRILRCVTRVVEGVFALVVCLRRARCFYWEYAMRKVLCTAVVATLATGLLVAAPANAGAITVANPSFEILPLGGLNVGCGGSCAYSVGLGVPDWTTTGYDTGQWIVGGYAGNPPAYVGSVLAYSNGGTIYQTVGNAVDGATYTLQVEVLHRTDLPIAGIVQLEIGGSPVATATDVDGGPGSWNNWTATYTATGGNGGQPLGILLSSTGGQGDFDDVRLSSNVPEPSTWALMLLGFAGLGFAGYRRTTSRLLAAA